MRLSFPVATRLAALALALVVAADLIVLIRAPGLWLVPAMLVGWFMADFMSGAIHMYMDYRPSRRGVGLDRLYFYEGSRESPEYLALRRSILARIGPIERIVYDFKTHHPRPDALGRRPLAAQVGSTILFATLPFALIANAVLAATGWPPFLLAMLLTFLAGSTFAQYFHGTLHRPDNPWPIRLMRRVRLLMRPEDHRRHHETLSHDFSTISGWSNPPLNIAFRVLRRRGYLHDDGLVPG